MKSFNRLATKKKNSVIDEYINTLSSHVDVLDKHILDAAGEADNQKLVNHLAQLRLLKANGYEKEGKLNNRPIGDINTDITNIEKSPEVSSSENQMKLKKLKAEKLISELKTSPGVGKKSNTGSGNTKLNDSFNLKFFGGTWNNKEKLGAMEYVDLLLDPNISVAEKTNYEARLSNFIASEYKKEEILNNLKDEYIEKVKEINLRNESRPEGTQPESTDPVIKSGKTGDRGSTEFTYGGMGKNNDFFIKQVSSENRVLEGISDIIFSEESLNVDPAQDNKYQEENDMAEYDSYKKSHEYNSMPKQPSNSAQELSVENGNVSSITEPDTTKTVAKDIDATPTSESDNIIKVSEEDGSSITTDTSSSTTSNGDVNINPTEDTGSDTLGLNLFSSETIDDTIETIFDSIRGLNSTSKIKKDIEGLIEECRKTLKGCNK